MLNELQSNKFDIYRTYAIVTQPWLVRDRKTITQPLKISECTSTLQVKGSQLRKSYLNLIAIPDSNSPDGWKPSGKGKLFIPNQDFQEVVVPDIRSLVTNSDVLMMFQVLTIVVNNQPR